MLHTRHRHSKHTHTLTCLNTCKICLATKNLIWSSFILNEVIYIQAVMLLKVRSHSLIIALAHNRTLTARTHTRARLPDMRDTHTNIYIHFPVVLKIFSRNKLEWFHRRSFVWWCHNKFQCRRLNASRIITYIYTYMCSFQDVSTVFLYMYIVHVQCE